MPLSDELNVEIQDENSFQMGWSISLPVYIDPNSGAGKISRH